ncbi:HNH endonuclease [Leucothrix arctica]|uniref:HNH endonuclease n=1 Tax=Leucothrix arctica TaxID=1481894 RepID=UPI001BA55203
MCSFDFKKVYGELGAEFCEVHHLKKLADAEKYVETTLSDLSVVCSNCHRIINRTNSMKTIAEMKDMLLLGK